MTHDYKRLALPLFAALLLCLFAGCQSVPTPKGSVAGYSSAEFFPTSGAYRSNELEDSPVLNQMIRDSIEAKFKANSVAFGEKDAELKVGYIIIRQNNAATILNDDHFGPGRDSLGILKLAHKRGVINKTPLYNYDAGAIVIDVVDANSGKLIYRDFAKNDVLPNISDEKRKGRVSAAVNEALAKFF